jgi:hypothetical protein
VLRKLKTQFDLENYLCADVNKKYISTFVKIRISNSNLNIEKGRYLNTPAEDITDILEKFFTTRL